MEKYAGNLVQVKEEFLYFTSFVMLYLLKSMKVLPEKKSLNICIAVLRAAYYISSIFLVLLHLIALHYSLLKSFNSLFTVSINDG